MPLYYADESIDPVSLLKVPERFIIFYASVVDGEMWCPDCRRVEKLVEDTFSVKGPDGLIVYVGTRSQWKTPENVYRQEPWKVTNIPTIVKLDKYLVFFYLVRLAVINEDTHSKGEQISRLDDDSSILQELRDFVDS